MPRPVNAQRFAVVDVETSGLSVRRDNVLQIGVVLIDGEGTVLDRWCSLVAPRRRWWYRVGPTKLHGIHRRDVRSAPPAPEVFAHLATLLQGTTFVAHNAPFDLAFLRKGAQRAGVPLALEDTVCTLRLSRRLDPDRVRSHRLSDLCVRYGIELVRPHDALADADATAALLPHLLREHGISDVDELLALPSRDQPRLAS